MPAIRKKTLLGLSALFCATFLFTGCAVISLTTMTVGAATTAVKVAGTTTKIVGKTAVGAAKLAIPDGDDDDKKEPDASTP